MYSLSLNQLCNNGDCAVDSLVYSDSLNNYIGGRQHIMSKPMTDVDMVCILFYFILQTQSNVSFCCMFSNFI